MDAPFTFTFHYTMPKKPLLPTAANWEGKKYQSQHIFAEKSFLDKFGYLFTLLIYCQTGVIAEKPFTLQLWSPETICADLSPFSNSLSPSKFSS